MQRRRARGGSSGELDVFGATSYFDDSLAVTDLAAGPVAVTAPQDLTIQLKVTAPQDLMIQAKVAPDMKHTEESYSSTQELGARARSNLGTFFCSLVSRPASFCDNRPPLAAISGSHDELPPQVRLPTSSSRACGDIITVAAARAHDLGVMVGDRRLQGVRVVHGDEARWVVRCGGHALEEEHGGAQEKIADDAASSDHGHQPLEVEGPEDGDDRGWDSDSSSDLFELDLEKAYTHQIDRRAIPSLDSPGPRLEPISE